MATHFFGLTSRTFRYSHSVGRAEFAGTGFRNATDMAIAHDGTVYVCNRSYENRPDGIHVTVLTLDEEYISEFGAYGEADGEFMWPTSVALDSKGNLYLADEWLNRITKFTKDGEFVSKWGTSGSGVGQLNRPNGLAVDADGDIYVADWMNNRVQVFAPDGRYVTEFHGQAELSKWGKDKLASNPDMIRQRSLAYANDPDYEKKLAHPCSVKIDPQGRICIIDHTRNRIQIYVKESEPALV